METLDAVVIGAGQAGLSASYHLRRRGIEHVLLDADPSPGGAWQHRWDTLTMRDVNGIADLPGSPVPSSAGDERANTFVPAYFEAYEREHDLPVLRPVRVRRVRAADDDPAGPLVVEPEGGRWTTHTVVNATGTWTRPFWPSYPGRETFLGEQVHTATYQGPEHFRDRRVAVVGGGVSAVQLLAELAQVTATLWVTRREPVWSTQRFTREVGREVVARVEQRVRAGLAPESVVRQTGLRLREQERAAARLGAYADRRAMFSSIEPDGLRWADGGFEPVEVILWATGFRAALDHLTPLRLREPGGGIRIGSVGAALGVPTTVLVDPRVHLVGYGPSASTIGANRAGLVAARAVRARLGDEALSLAG